MNSQKQPSALAASILSAINTNMDSALKQAELVQKAKDAADASRKASQQKYAVVRNQVKEAIVELGTELNRMLEDENKAAETAYNETLVKLGLKSEDHPFTPAVEKADEAITFTLSTAGTGARKIADIGQGIANRFMKGFNSK